MDRLGDLGSGRQDTLSGRLGPETSPRNEVVLHGANDEPPCLGDHQLSQRLYAVVGD